MSVSAEIETDSLCHACGAEGDVIATRQQLTPRSVVSVRNFCVPCFRAMVKVAEFEIAAFVQSHGRFPEARIA